MTAPGGFGGPPRSGEVDRWEAFVQQRQGNYGGRPYLPLTNVGGLGTAIQVLLGVQILTAIALLFPAFDERSAINRILDDPGSVGRAEADRLDDRLNAVSLLGTGVYLATGIVFVIWFYRVRENAGVWAPQLQRRSQGWSVGGWVCPIVSLWFPFMIAKDAVDSSDPDQPHGFPLRKARPLLVVWWIAFVVMQVSSLAVARLDPDDAESYRTYADWVIVDTVLTIVAVVPAILVVRQLTGLQSRRIAAERAAV